MTILVTQILKKGRKCIMLERVMDLYRGTDEVAPIAEGVRSYPKKSADIDCNCVDGNCTNCD